MKRFILKNMINMNPHLAWLLMMIVFVMFSLSLLIIDDYNRNSFGGSDFSISLDNQAIGNVSTIVDDNNLFVNAQSLEEEICEEDCEQKEENKLAYIEEEGVEINECDTSFLDTSYDKNSYKDYKHGNDFDAELILENFYVNECGLLVFDFSWNINPKEDIYILEDQYLKLLFGELDSGFEYGLDVASGTQIKNARGFEFINNRLQTLTINIYVGGFSDNGIYEIAFDYILYRDNNGVLRKKSVKNTKNIRIHVNPSGKITILN